MDRVIHDIRSALKLTTTRMNVATLADLTAADAPAMNREGFDKEARSIGGAWYGGLASIDDARALFAAGWQAGADRAESLRPALANVIPAGTITRRRRVTGDHGEELRIDAVLAGNWDAAYTRREMVRASDPAVISIAAGWMAAASTSHEDLIWNALQAIVLTDALEQAGYRVELRAIDGATTTQHHGFRQVLDLTMKAPEEPLRADLVAAMIGHGGVYRTLGFKAMWCVPMQQQGSLGRCFYGKDQRQAITDAVDAGMIPPVSYVLPRADSADAARANLTAAVAALFPERSAAA